MNNKFIDIKVVEGEKQLVLKTVEGKEVITPLRHNYNHLLEEDLNWYGYIYISVLPNEKVYVGKHKSNKVDKAYKGSGTVYRHAEDYYGKENVETYILDYVELPEDILFEDTKRNTEVGKELGKQLSELEATYIKHKFGIDIESPIHFEFYNMPTGFTQVNMKKEVEDYEERLYKVFNGSRDHIREYTRINLFHSKKETLKLLSKQDYLTKEELSKAGIKNVFTEEQVFNLLTKYYQELPCLYETMYHSFVNEVNDLPTETIEDYIDEDRWEPFTKYIMKYLLQKSNNVEVVEKEVIHESITVEMYEEVKRRLEDACEYASVKRDPDAFTMESIREGTAYLNHNRNLCSLHSDDVMTIV